MPVAMVLILLHWPKEIWMQKWEFITIFWRPFRHIYYLTWVHCYSKMHSHLIQNDMLLFGFYISPWTNKPHFCFVLFLTLVTHHGKLSLLDRGNIYNFSLLFRENKWGSHGLSNATKLARQIQEIGEIWVGFSQWQLDFGSSCGFTTAAAERKPHIETGKKGLEIYMHRLERALLDFTLPLLCFMAFFMLIRSAKSQNPQHLNLLTYFAGNSALSSVAFLCHHVTHFHLAHPGRISCRTFFICSQELLLQGPRLHLI